VLTVTLITGQEDENDAKRVTPVAIHILAVVAIIASAAVGSLAVAGKLNFLLNSTEDDAGSDIGTDGLPNALNTSRINMQLARLKPQPASQTPYWTDTNAARWSWFPDDVMQNLRDRIEPTKVAIPVESAFLGEWVVVVDDVDARRLLDSGTANSIRLIGGRTVIVPALQALVLAGDRATLKQILTPLPRWSVWEGLPVRLLQQIYVAENVPGAYPAALRAFRQRRFDVKNQTTPGVILAVEYGLRDALKESFVDPGGVRDWSNGSKEAQNITERAKILKLLYGDDHTSQVLLTDLETVFPFNSRTASMPLLAYFGHRLNGDFWTNPSEAWRGLHGNGEKARSLIARMELANSIEIAKNLPANHEVEIARSVMATWRYIASAEWRSNGFSETYHRAMASAVTFPDRLLPCQVRDAVGLSYDIQLYEGKTDYAIEILEKAERCAQEANSYRDLDLLARAWWQIIGDGQRSRQHLASAAIRARNYGHVQIAMEYMTQFGDVRSAAECLLRGESDAPVTKQWCALAMAWRWIPGHEREIAHCIDEGRKRARDTMDLANIAEVELTLPNGVTKAQKTLEAAKGQARTVSQFVRLAFVYGRSTTDEAPVREMLAGAIKAVGTEKSVSSAGESGVAWAYRQLLDDADAARACLDLAKDQCMDADAWLRCADGYIHLLNDVESTRFCLENAKEWAEDLTLLNVASGYMDWLGDREEAMNCLDRASKSADLPIEFTRLAEAYMTITGDREKALEILNKAEAAAKHRTDTISVREIAALMGT
jgi:tetratricopeptide (TPR) repeat protein